MLGTAVGDALGLPLEGLSAQRAARYYPGPLRHRMAFGRGWLSDDTEHTCLVGQALLASGGDPARFARSLGWRLRGWLLGCPAGIGWATLRALLKLTLGVPPRWSGVRSAGNGPAMRAPLLGVYLGDTPALRALLEVATRITHTDPKAYEGALAVALAADGAARGEAPDALLGRLDAELEGDELRRSLESIAAHLARGAEPPAFAEALGQARGISGYVNHTVPAVLYCYLRSPEDFAQSLEAVIRLGGDADTTGAILGGIAGARAGAAGIPEPWVAGVRDYPRSVPWLRELARRLAAQQAGEDARPLGLFWPAIPLRNALFATVVLVHGFRRLLPPY
ncbi:MAG: ADP-ribosylglycohydrolase family protein [Planctomycetota bacterium]